MLITCVVFIILIDKRCTLGCVKLIAVKCFFGSAKNSGFPLNILVSVFLFTTRQLGFTVGHKISKKVYSGKTHKMFRKKKPYRKAMLTFVSVRPKC